MPDACPCCSVYVGVTVSAESSVCLCAVPSSCTRWSAGSVSVDFVAMCSRLERGASCSAHAYKPTEKARAQEGLKLTVTLCDLAPIGCTRKAHRTGVAGTALTAHRSGPAEAQPETGTIECVFASRGYGSLIWCRARPLRGDVPYFISWMELGRSQRLFQPSVFRRFH